MKPVIGDSLADDAVHRAGRHFAPEGGRQAGAGVIDQYDENVGRILGQTTRLDAPLVD